MLCLHDTDGNNVIRDSVERLINPTLKHCLAISSRELTVRV